VQLREALLGGNARSGLDHTAVERDEPPATARDDAIAGVCEARIDSQHDHLFDP